jgi:ankyrin repeat protein
MTKKEKNKALLEGCESGDYNKVRLALNFGADVNAKKYDGRTPLHWASRYNDIEIAKLLLKAGADVEAINDYGETPLHWASRYNRIEIVGLLLEKGADMGAKNRWENTPLGLADSDEMKALLKKYQK